ncbi:MAG: alpha/beta hydrolase [bacterium]
MKSLALMLGLIVAMLSCAVPQGRPNVPTPVLWPENEVITGGVYHYENFPSKNIIPRQISVWLPPGYKAQPARRYPVLYMHDGQNLFDPAYSSYSHEEWGMDETMTRLIKEGQIEPAIIVGIWSIPETRFLELMPQQAVTKENIALVQVSYPQAGMENLLGDKYLHFITDELKPFIDQQYRTLPDQPHSFIMGSSMGGLMSCYAIAQRPDIFAGAACLSSHWPVGDGVVVEWMGDHFPSPETHKIYFDYGTETLDAAYEPYQRRVDAYALAAGYVTNDSMLSVKFEGHPHSETAWKVRVNVPLQFLLGTNSE